MGKTTSLCRLAGLNVGVSGTVDQESGVSEELCWMTKLVEVITHESACPPAMLLSSNSGGAGACSVKIAPPPIPAADLPPSAEVAMELQAEAGAALETHVAPALVEV